MHILVVSQFFHPEMGAPAARFGDLGSHFVRAGHRVTVLTTWPNFPNGRIYPGHTQRATAREYHGGIEVIRTPILALGGAGAKHKALLYASFVGSAAVQALLQGALGGLRPDIVIGTTPPPTVGHLSLLLAKAFGVPHVLDVRDIWPEAVVASGRVKAGAAVRVLEALNAVVLRQSAAVTTVSQGKRTRLAELGAPIDKVHVLPNGVDLERVDGEADAQVEPARQWLREVGVPQNKHIVLYAGVFNPAQGLDLVLDAARARRDRPEDTAHFVLVGDGSMRAHLLERIAKEELRNVTLAGPVERALVAGLYRCAYVTLVILRARKDEHTVPSKLYEAMASRRPVALSADGEVARLAAQAGCGPVSAAGDLEGLGQGLDSLLGDAEAAARQGAAGRDYVEKHNDRAVLATEYLRLLAAAVDAARGA